MAGIDDIAPGGPSSSDTEATPLLRATTANPNHSSSMVEKNIGISQQTLVSNAGDRNVAAAAKLPQYMAGVSATLGALAMGMVLGWSSGAGDGGAKVVHDFDVPISADEFSWISSLVTLGAAAICVPIGILSDLIGRKTAMLMLVVPFTVGWLLIIFANSVLMFFLGRFILGVSGGAFCVTAPTYTAEIAESSIRGTLGSYFQLMLTVGILVSYVLAPQLNNMLHLSIISAIVPIIFFCVFFFMPETPIYYLKNGNEDAARASLVRLRGPRYNVEPEMLAQQEIMAEAERNRTSFFEEIRSKAAVKGLIIGFGLMFFQQLSGVNAIIFYATQIFTSANKDFDSSLATIIVGVIQVVAVFLSTLIVDRLGRRILLLASNVAMFITTFVLGIYFYLKHNGTDVTNIGWLPLLCICTFVFLFSLGFGPIPWMMMGEIYSPTVKGIAGSSACLFNWLMAFVVTKYYQPLEDAAGTYTCFWLFSIICAIGTVFVFMVVPETKGKTLEEIQYELGGSSPASRRYSDKS